MADEWYYMQEDQRRGPVDLETLRNLVGTGAVTGQSSVWRPGLARWMPAAQVGELFPPDHATGSPPPPPAAALGAAQQGANLLRNIGARISKLTDLPEIGDVPVWDILFGELFKKSRKQDVEERLIVGTKHTTPSLSQLEQGWPRARLCWLVLAGALATYFLLRLGWTEFHNPNRLPAMMVVGSFVVPLAMVIFFFEMNTPSNVSVFQVGKMMLFGGALSIVTNALLGQIITGSGTGRLIPSMLTGFAEETAKAIALLLIITNKRYPWQLNGLLFGAAVGAGFAGFESAGYAFKPVWENPGAPIDELADEIMSSITQRGLFAPGGHIIWTGMVASAIWKIKGDRPLSFSMLKEGVLVRRWLAAVVLHGIWDSDFVVSFFGRLFSEETCSYAQCIILSIVGWYIVLAILKQALSEVAAARIAEIAASSAVTPVGER